MDGFCQVICDTCPESTNFVSSECLSVNEFTTDSNGNWNEVIFKQSFKTTDQDPIREYVMLIESLSSSQNSLFGFQASPSLPGGELESVYFGINN